MTATAEQLPESGRLEIEYVQLVSFIAKVRGEQKVVDKFNRSLARVMDRGWQPIAKRAVTDAMKEFKGERSVNQVARIVSQVEKALRSFQPKITSVVNRQVDIIYRTMTENFLSKFDLKIEKAILNAKLEIDLSAKDRQAIDAIQMITNQSAGVLFPESVVDKVVLAVSDVVFEQGLPSEEAARRIENEIKGALGSNALDKTVPTRFLTNPEDYFDTLANNATLLSNNMGSMISMSEAGVENYRVLIIEDKRTSRICLAMQDRIISVDSGMKMVDQILGFTSARELKAAFTGIRDDQEKILALAMRLTTTAWQKMDWDFRPIMESVGQLLYQRFE
ncbi:MAG: hypothetical protein R3B45_07600 [Bdellovibrionota bacterium]